MSEPKILRLKSVLTKTGLTRATLYRLIKHDQFPKQIKISMRCVGWPDDLVQQWIDARVSGVESD